MLYLAQDPMTAFAETIVRDRFEKGADRVLLEEELNRYSITDVRNPRPLFLLDLRNEGATCSVCPPMRCAPRRKRLAGD